MKKILGFNSPPPRPPPLVGPAGSGSNLSRQRHMKTRKQTSSYSHHSYNNYTNNPRFTPYVDSGLGFNPFRTGSSTFSFGAGSSSSSSNVVDSGLGFNPFRTGSWTFSFGADSSSSSSNVVDSGSVLDDLRKMQIDSDGSVSNFKFKFNAGESEGKKRFDESLADQLPKEVDKLKIGGLGNVGSVKSRVSGNVEMDLHNEMDKMNLGKTDRKVFVFGKSKEDLISDKMGELKVGGGRADKEKVFVFGSNRNTGNGFAERSEGVNSEKRFNNVEVKDDLISNRMRELKVGGAGENFVFGQNVELEQHKVTESASSSSQHQPFGNVLFTSRPEKNVGFTFSSKVDNVGAANFEFKMPDNKGDLFSGVKSIPEPRLKKKKGKVRKPVISQPRPKQDFVFGQRSSPEEVPESFSTASASIAAEEACEKWRLCQIRITTPVKGHLCKHPQCFDYDGFMENNSVWPTWKCPVCTKSVCNLDIRIDQTFLKILNEVANTGTDVILSEDGSWIFATTENSQATKTNKDGLSQNKQTPDTAGKTTSIDTNEILPNSSPALHRSSGSESSLTAEEPSTMTMPEISPLQILQDCCLQLKGSHDMLHTPAPVQRISNHLNPDNLPTNEPINSLNNASQSDHTPDTAENTSSIQAGEVLPISSPALHNLGGSANSLTAERTSTLWKSTVTTPACSPHVSMDSSLQSQGSHDVHISAAEQIRHHLDPINLPTSQVSYASKNQIQNLHEANTTGNIEADAALPNSSSALDNSGGSANSLTAEKPSTLHQSTVTTPAVPLPQVLKDSCLQSQDSDDMIITPPSVQKIRNHADLVNLHTTQPSYGVSNRIQNDHAPDTSKNAISMEANEALPHSSSVLHDSDGSANRSYAELPSTLRQSPVTMPAVSPQVLMDSCLQSQGSYDIQKPPSVQQLSHHLNPVNLPTTGPSYGLTSMSHLSSQSQPQQHQTDRATQAHPGPSMPVELPPTSASLHSTALAGEHLMRVGEKQQYTARGQPRKGISIAKHAQRTTLNTPSATSSQQPIAITSEQFMRGITERQYRPRGQPRGRPRRGIATTEQPQSTALVTPSATSPRAQQPMTPTSEKLMKGDGQQHNTSPGESQVNVGTTKQTQDTTMFAPVECPVPTPHSAPALAHAANIRPLSPIRHPKPSGDTMPSECRTELGSG